MGAFYGRRIRNEEINPKTGKAWKLEDIPSFWQEKTNKWLKNN